MNDQTIRELMPAEFELVAGGWDSQDNGNVAIGLVLGLLGGVPCVAIADVGILKGALHR